MPPPLLLRYVTAVNGCMDGCIIDTSWTGVRTAEFKWDFYLRRGCYVSVYLDVCLSAKEILKTFSENVDNSTRDRWLHFGVDVNCTFFLVVQHFLLWQENCKMNGDFFRQFKIKQSILFMSIQLRWKAPFWHFAGAASSAAAAVLTCCRPEIMSGQSSGHCYTKTRQWQWLSEAMEILKGLEPC